jgi:hypothetical protein
MTSSGCTGWTLEEPHMRQEETSEMNMAGGAQQHETGKKLSPWRHFGRLQQEADLKTQSVTRPDRATTEEPTTGEVPSAGGRNQSRPHHRLPVGKFSGGCCCLCTEAERETKPT